MIIPREASAAAPVRRIPIYRIKLPPERHFFGRDRIEAMASFIGAFGLMDPIDVKRISEGYELVHGRRRLLAAQWLGWRSIDARILPAV